AGQVRADGVRRDPRRHDDRAPTGPVPRPPAPAGARPYRRGPPTGGALHVSAQFEATGVTKRFGGLTAVHAVDYRLESGIASIIGPNGAGQTTLFNIFTGVYACDEGTVSFRGTPLVGLRPDQITALGVCRTFQNIRLFANMTAIENVLVGMHPRVPLGIWDAIG